MKILKTWHINYKRIEYIPDESGTARLVKCPLVDDWIQDIDCLENQGDKGNFYPSKIQVEN